MLLATLLATLLLGCMQLTAEEIVKKMQKKYESIKDEKGTMIIKALSKEKQIKFAIKIPDKYRWEDENTLTVSNGKIIGSITKS